MAHDVATLSIGSGPKNEDRVISIERGATRLIVVADGAGGTGNGAEAAELALKSIIDSRLIPTLVRDPNYWSQTLSLLDGYVYGENEAGECTIVVVGPVDHLGLKWLRLTFPKSTHNQGDQIQDSSKHSSPPHNTRH